MNYPDDYRDWSTTDPRSPFYEEPPTCPECGEEVIIEQDYDDWGYAGTIIICTNPDCPECDDYESQD